MKVLTRPSLKVLALSLAALVLLAGSLKDSAVFVFRFRAPDLVRTLDAKDPIAIISAFQRDIAKNSGDVGASLGKWERAARRSLAAEPLSPAMLYLMALAQGKEGPNSSAQRRLMQLSEQISKRDLSVQLWLIEDAVSRNDVAAALGHYDKALSVHPEAGSLLYPILTTAIEDPEIGRGLAPLLRIRPWSGGFLTYMSEHTADYSAATNLFKLYGGSHAVAGHRIYETFLLQRAVQAGQFQLAQNFGAWMSRNAVTQAASFDFSPETVAADLHPLTWTVGEDENVTAEFDPGAGVKAVVGPGGRGIAASRITILTGGTWRFQQIVEFAELSPMADANWLVECLKGQSATKIFQQDIPRHPGRRTYADRFVVPADCPAVRFSLVVRGITAQVDAEIAIRSVRLQHG